MTIFKEYTFEASHTLEHMPPDHKCRRLHGHSYRLVVEVDGAVDPETMMVHDFAVLDAIVRPVIDALDHRHLNDVLGHGQPTCEAILQWIARKLAGPLNDKGRLELWETAKCGARISLSGDPYDR